MASLVQAGGIGPRPGNGWSVAARNTSTTMGLVGWFTMDNQDLTGASTFHDRSRNGYDAQLYSAGRVAGKIGQAINIVNTSCYTEGPGPILTSAVTLATWVMPTGTGSNLFIISKATHPSSGTENRNYCLLYRNSSTPQLSFSWTNGNSVYIEYGCNYTLPLNAWSHFVATALWTGPPATVSFFVNGVPAVPVSLIFGTDSGGPDTAAMTLRLGGFLNSGGPLGFLGLIDDVRIYNRVLSPAEIRALYNRPAADYVYNADRINRIAAVAAAAGGPAWAARVMVQV